MRGRRTQAFRPARLLTAAGALAAAATIAACGSNSPAGSSAPTGSGPSTGSGSSSTSSTLAFSECMRANGVPNFADLSNNGMRIEASGQTISVNGVWVNAPAFQAARQRCQKYRPHSDVSPAQTAQQIRQGLQFARCMRSHGVPNFPDPEVRTGAGGNQEAYLPGVDIQSPAVQFAAKGCGGGPKGP